jgi:hypothetical protein
MGEPPARILAAATGNQDSNLWNGGRGKDRPEEQAMACDLGNLNAARHVTIEDIGPERLLCAGRADGRLSSGRCRLDPT